MKFIKKIGLKNYWIFTYMVVFLIPIVILSATLFKVENTVIDFANSYSTNILNQTQNRIDDEIKNIHQFTVNLSNFEDLTELMKLSELTVNDTMKYYGIQDSIYKSAVNYNIDVNSYIYLKNSDSVVTSAGIISSYSAYVKFAADYDISYEEWKEIFSGEKQLGFWKMEGNSEKTDKLYIYCALKDKMFTEAKAVAVIKVNENHINELIEKNLYGGTVYMLDSDGNNIFTFGDKIEFPNVELNDMFFQGKHIKNKIGKDTYLFSATESSVGKYSYLVAIPMNSLTKQVSFLKFWLFFLISFTIILGVIIVIKMVKKNYRPIEDLIYQLESTVLDDDNKNPLTYKSIDEIKKKLVTYSKNYNYGQKAIQATKINRLLNFEIENFKENDLNGLFSEFNGGSLVVIFEPDKYEDFFDNESESEKIDTVHFMINNVLTEILDDTYFLTTEIKRNIVCIIACNYEKRDEFNAELLERIEKLKAFFDDNFGFEISVALGSYEKGTVGIRESYINAQDTIVYKAVFGSNDILQYSEICDRENKYYFSADDLKLLTNYIRFKNSELAIKFIDEIFEDNIYIKRISYKYIRILLFEIVITIQKSIEDLNEYTEIRNNEIFKILQSHENLEKFKEDIMLLVENVCKTGSDNSSENEVCKRIVEYINHNYANSNLSNDDIADYCGLSKSYLSTIFKREKKENLVSYITKFRVEKSKELLVSELNISDVAQQSGFVNSNTYIRAFKKYEGVTPGMWRKRIND